MITDKDREEANGVYAAHLGGGIEYAAIEIARIRAESAEQARKEAAERNCATCRTVNETACPEPLECKYRAAILGEVKQ